MFKEVVLKIHKKYLEKGWHLIFGLIYYDIEFYDFLALFEIEMRVLIGLIE